MNFPIWIPFVNEWYTCILFLGTIAFLVLISELMLNMNLLTAESNRRLIHVLVGFLISSSPLIFTSNQKPALLAIIFIALNTFAIKSKSFKGIHSQKRITYGTIYFPLSYLIIILFFWDYSELIIISLSILAFSDPIASYFGSKSADDKTFVVWVDKKSMVGTIAFLISSFLITYILSHYLLDISIEHIMIQCILISFGSTIAELTSNKGSDNFSIPIFSILLLIGLNDLIVNKQMNILDIVQLKVLPVMILTLLFYFAYNLNTLNMSGFFGGLMMGVLIIILSSPINLITLTTFFVFSSILSKILKNPNFIVEKGSKRDLIQVYANGGIPLFFCVIDFFFPHPFNKLLFFSSVSAAMSDTWATEFGKLSKIKPISITTLKTVEHGISGGITRIGILGSLLGSCIIGLLSWILIPASDMIVYGIIFSGFLGSIFDSFIGSLFQAKYRTDEGMVIEKNIGKSSLISGLDWVTNDIVNLANTAFAPLIMYIFFLR